MDKLAAYEMLLEDHPLWKEAEAFTPRSQAEMDLIDAYADQGKFRGALGGAALGSLVGLPLGPAGMAVAPMAGLGAGAVIGRKLGEREAIRRALLRRQFTE